MAKEHEVSDNFEFACLMVIAHTTQAEGWAYFLKGRVHKEFKYRLDLFLQASKSLLKHIEKDNDMDGIQEDAEVFSNTLEIIRKAKTFEQKRQLYYVLRDATEGKLKVLDDDGQLKTLEL